MYRSTRRAPGRGGLDARHLNGRFAIIGDVHGAIHTLEHLLRVLDHRDPDLTLVSVGDLNDKGGPIGINHPAGVSASGVVRVLRWAMEASASGKLLVTDSNHGRSLASSLATRRDPATAKPNLARTLRDLYAQDDAETLVPAVQQFLADLPPFIRLQGGPTGEVVVAHAAVAERLLDARTLSGPEYDFHLYPREFRWTGPQTVVTGHVHVDDVTRIRSERGGPLIRIDTGCPAPHGKLTAYLPHLDETVSVPVDERDAWQRIPVAPLRPAPTVG